MVAGRLGTARSASVSVARTSVALVLTALTGAALARTALGRLSTLTSGPLTPHDVPGWVGWLVLVLGAVATARLALGCVALLLAAAGRSLGLASATLEQLACRLAPRLLRRVLVVTVGGLMVSAPALAATAGEPDLGWTVTSQAAVTEDPDGALEVGWLPTVGPTAAAAPAPTTPVAEPEVAAAPPSAEPAREAASPAPLAPVGATAPAADPGRTPISPTEADPPAAGPTAAGPTAAPVSDVVVAPGDSLWAIAARHLPEDASPAEVAAALPRWYAANEQVIGADPDLILPGQHLRAPAPGAPATDVVPTPTHQELP